MRMEGAASVYHLYGSNELSLVCVAVSEIHPDVGDVCCRLSHCSEDLARLRHSALLRQHTPHSVRSVHILRVVPSVYKERPQKLERRKDIMPNIELENLFDIKKNKF